MKNRSIIVLIVLSANIYTQDTIVEKEKNQPTIINNTQLITPNPTIAPSPVTQTTPTQIATEKKGIWQKDIEQHHNHACIRRINKLYTQVK